MTKSIKVSLILTIAFAGIIRLRPVWERSPGGLWNVLFFLLIATLFFWIAIKILMEIVGIVKKRKALKSLTFLPLVILSIGILDGIYNPLKINLENIHGAVLFRACFEGTQNQATFKLREGHKFELHWTGVFFYDELFIGTYQQIGDTLILDYEGDRPKRFGDKIFMDNVNQSLQTIRQEGDNLEYVVPFYFGYCKGLN